MSFARKFCADWLWETLALWWGSFWKRFLFVSCLTFFIGIQGRLPNGSGVTLNEWVQKTHVRAGKSALNRSLRHSELLRENLRYSTLDFLRDLRKITLLWYENNFVGWLFLGSSSGFFLLRAAVFCSFLRVVSPSTFGEQHQLYQVQQKRQQNV